MWEEKWCYYNIYLSVPNNMLLVSRRHGVRWRLTTWSTQEGSLPRPPSTLSRVTCRGDCVSRCPWDGGPELRVPRVLRPVRLRAPRRSPTGWVYGGGSRVSRHLLPLLSIITFLFACFSLFTSISLNVLFVSVTWFLYSKWWVLTLNLSKQSKRNEKISEPASLAISRIQ